MKICTWNLCGLSENSKKIKKDCALKTIGQIGANIFGLQGINTNDICSILQEIENYNPNLHYNSVSCENFGKRDEGIVLFYDYNFRFEKQQFLEVDGKRRTLYVKLKEKRGNIWHFYVSHLYEGRKYINCRGLEVLNIMKHMEKKAMRKKYIFFRRRKNRIVLMGSLNMRGCEEFAYKNIVEKMNDVGMLKNIYAKQWKENRVAYESLYTHSENGAVCKTIRSERFDFIFAWPQSFLCGEYEVFCDVVRFKHENINKYPQGKSPSNHLPVIWTFEKKNVLKFFKK